MGSHDPRVLPVERLLGHFDLVPEGVLFGTGLELFLGAAMLPLIPLASRPLKTLLDCVHL